MENIIFLDLDGVLNIVSGDNPTYLSQENHFESKLVQNFNELLHESDILLVMSSSWRNDFDDALKQLEMAGFEHFDRFIDITGNLNHRGLEIEEWLGSDFKGKYLCVDDNIKEIKQCIPMENILEVDPSIGLNVDYIDKIKSHFDI